MENHEEARLRYVLSCIYGDFVEGTLPPISGEKHRLDFIDHYTEIAARRKYVDGHEKFVFIMMEYALDAIHSDDLCWSAQGVIEEDFYNWLYCNNPDIWLGELNGKHRDETEKFNDLLVEDMDDYFRVEAKKYHMPECLRDLHDQWKDEQSEEEDEEVDLKESPKKRARTEKEEKHEEVSEEEIS